MAYVRQLEFAHHSVRDVVLSVSMVQLHQLRMKAFMPMQST